MAGCMAERMAQRLVDNSFASSVFFCNSGAEANEAADQARADLEKSIARRMAAAEEQIDSAQAAAVKEVRDQAVVVAIAAAKDVIAKKMTAAEGNALIDSAIAEVDTKLH